MKKTAIVILLVVLGIANTRAQNSMEDRLKSEAKDDAKTLSTSNYPYIDQFHLGVREMLSGNNAEAKKAFQKCLETRKNDDAVYYALAQIETREKNTMEALKHYQMAHSLDPSNVIYTKRLAESYFDRGDFDKAKPLFEKLCRLDPQNAEYRFGYSKVLIYLKLYKQAIAELDKLQEETGVVPQLKLMEADLYSELKQYDQQEAILLDLKSKFPTDSEVLKALFRFYDKKGEDKQAYAVVEQMLKNDPDNGMAQIILAKNYLKNANTDKFVQLAPHIFSNDNVSVEHKLFILKAYKAIIGSSNPEVYKITENLYEAHADDANVALNYARSLIAQHNSNEALAVFRKAILQHKDNYSLWSQTLLFEEDYLAFSALYEDAEKALNLFPSMPFVYFEAAKGALETNHLDEAEQILAGGELYLVGDNEQAAKFAQRKGEIFFTKKNYKKGIVSFEKALSLSDHSSIKIAYAYALAQTKIAPEIASQLLEKVKGNEKSRDYYRASALLLMNKAQWKAAIIILQKGIDNEFNNAELYDMLGDCYSFSGSNSKAIEAWKMAKEGQSRNSTIDQKIKEEKYYAPHYL